MKYTSQIIAQGSGSVAGCTFARNRFGPYVRNRTLPVNPNSTQQSSIRAIFGNCAIAWLALNVSDRLGWDQYALATPKTDALGRTIYLTGFNWFCAVNSVREYFGKATFAAPPSQMGLTPLAPITLSITGGQFSVTYENTDPWAQTTGGHLFLFAGNQLNPTRNFYAGPFRKGLAVNGNTTPPTSPATFAPHYTPISGMVAWVRAIACDADGRLSAPQIVRGEVV